MRLLSFLSIFCTACVLQGCIGAAIVGTAAVATKSATDPRSVGQQVDDSTLAARVSGALNQDKELTQTARVNTTVYKGRVLLTGQVPNQALSDRAKQTALQVNGVDTVYDELRQGSAVDLGTASQDTWITTKIKSQILTSDSVKTSNVKVITENGEVFLLGVLTRQEGAEAARIASETAGVLKVTTAFTYLN